MNTNFIEKLKNQSVKDEKWLRDAQWRQDNKAWLDISFAIAVKVLSTLRERNMSQKDLAELLGLTPQYVNKIVKGSENLTIDTISKIEQALRISLIEVPEFTSIESYVPTGLFSDMASFQFPVSLPVEPVEMDVPKELCCENNLQAA